MNPIQKIIYNLLYQNRRDWIWPNPYNETNPIDVGPYVSWKFCENFFKGNLRVQKVIFNTKLAPLRSYEFKRMFFEFAHGTAPNLFKCQWLMNDYFTNTGLNYPIQINYHKWQLHDQWLINPGWLRYYIAHLDGQTEMPALYQPIFKTNLPVIEEYYSLEDMASAHKIETSKTFISVTWFYRKPLMQISFNPDHPTRDKYEHVEYYENQYSNFFLNRIKHDKILYICNDICKARIENELRLMPEYLQSLITFTKSECVGAIVTLDDYSDDGFYCGFALFGTHLTNISLPKIGLTYTSN
jgi:hypothetical protein